MEHDPEKLAYLERLGDVLTSRGFSAQIISINTKPHLKVANAETPKLNERVQVEQAEDGSWCYWWPWQQPIGSVDDLETVIGKVASVLRSAGDEQ